MNSISEVNWKSIFRTIIGWFYYHSGLFALHLWWCRRVGRKVLVLTFHRVLPANSPVLQEHLSLRSLIITQENFRQLLNFLKKHFHFLSLPEYAHRVCNGDSFQHSYCIITFDDGYHDFLQYVWPVLKTAPLPVTMFLPTALIGTSHSFWWDTLYYTCMRVDSVPMSEIVGPADTLLHRIADAPLSQRQRLVYQLIELMQDWPVKKIQVLIDSLATRQQEAGQILEHENALLNWDEVKSLRISGVYFGSHTRRHLNLAKAALESLQEEVALSKHDLESTLNESIDSFSFPGGHISDEVLEVVAQSGYSHACSTRKGLNRPGEDMLRLRRVNVWDGMLQDFRGRFSPAVFALNLMR